MQIREWFIQLDGHSEGPFSIEDLKKEYRITPDTLAWREGQGEWLPMRSIPELKEVFADDNQAPASENEQEFKPQKLLGEDEVLTVNFPPPYLITGLLLLIILLVLLLIYN